MLSLIKNGEQHRQADRLNERLISSLNQVLEKLGVPGCAYGLASYFHILLGRDTPRPSDGVEWPSAEAPGRMRSGLLGELKRAMLNHGVDLMGGSGGFTSAVHTEQNIDQTVKAFEAAVREMKAEGLL